jgi:hypothetical protein
MFFYDWDCKLSGYTRSLRDQERTRGMNITAPLSYDRCGEQVEEMMQRGIAFGDVEDAIEAAELLSDQKAALWLLAWSLRSPARQRQDARLMARWFAKAAWPVGD